MQAEAAEGFGRANMSHGQQNRFAGTVFLHGFKSKAGLVEALELYCCCLLDRFKATAGSRPRGCKQLLSHVLHSVLLYRLG
jgi:hypothetical protein